jgi:hypothetical protein
MSPIAVFAYFIIAAVGATAAALVLRATRKKVMGNIKAMTAWAQAHGWRVTEGSDPAVSELVDEMSTLLAEEGRRGVGVVMVGPTRAGQVIVIEGWLDDAETRSAERGPSVGVAFDSASVAVSQTLLEVGWNGHVRPVEGECAATPAQELALAGLPRGSRMRVMEKRLLLRTPGYLTGKTIEQLLERLARLEAAQQNPGRVTS